MNDLADGIYFNLDADAYHKLERLSTSAIQKLNISPANFWAGSWLDPDRPTDDEDATAAQIFGRFSHTARLEPHLLESQYVRKIEKADFPVQGACYTGTDIEAQLVEKGLPKTVKGEKVLDKAYRLYDAGYKAVIWPILMDAWEEERGTRIGIAGKGWDETVRDASRLRSIPEIAQLLEGGAAEVSILWTCPRTGIKMKARLDYLRSTDWTDFKTFANPMGKHLAQVITDAYRFNRYYIQASNYRDAALMICSGAVDIVGDATDEQRAIVDGLRALEDEPACWYVFQEKGGVPNILARRVRFFDRMTDEAVEELVASGAHEDKILAARRAADMATPIPSLLHEKALRDIERAKRDFMAYSDIYARGEPWLPIHPVGEISDADFNTYWLEDRS